MEISPFSPSPLNTLQTFEVRGKFEIEKKNLPILAPGGRSSGHLNVGGPRTYSISVNHQRPPIGWSLCHSPGGSIDIIDLSTFDRSGLVSPRGRRGSFEMLFSVPIIPRIPPLDPLTLTSFSARNSRVFVGSSPFRTIQTFSVPERPTRC